MICMDALMNLITKEFRISYIQSPEFWGIVFEIVVILLIIVVYNHAKKSTNKSKTAIIFWYFFEVMYWFFEEILWEKMKSWIKSYVVNLFFVILIANFIWLTMDFLIFPFPYLEWKIVNPSSNITFNFAIAVVSVLITLFIQAKHLWWFRFIHEYIPIFGKDVIPIERGNLPAIAYYPIKAIAKIFDIWISLFLWMLDIIWTIAKVISLSFRLYGNMISWSILLWLLVPWLASMTAGFLKWLELPIWLPIILYIQWLLVAFIQAFVFSLLISIFIKSSIWADD